MGITRHDQPIDIELAISFENTCAIFVEILERLVQELRASFWICTSEPGARDYWKKYEHWLT